MTREEAVRDRTVARFLECEAKRIAARAAALAAGKSEDEARDIAHEEAKKHWNFWADSLLAKRKQMEEAGAWAAEKELFGHLEPKNGDTRQWMEEAEASFSRCLFLVRGDEGRKETAGEAEDKPEAGSLPVKSIAVDGARVDMRDFVFPGAAHFDSAKFSGDAWFDHSIFSGDGSFYSTTFSGNARFYATIFSNNAYFDSATFSGPLFGLATFARDARFPNAKFSGFALFDSATFAGNALFEGAIFSRGARFYSVTFSGDARFDSAKFLNEATASFDRSTFSGNAVFPRATFSGDALFGSATFLGNAFFESAAFSGSAWFYSATFAGNAQFYNAKFQSYASFGAARSEGAFTMARVEFGGVPDFIQAHFAEAPRLDNLQVAPSPKPELLTEDARRDQLSRWRALKRLAIEAHDSERELEFNAQEISAARSFSNWPIPVRLCDGGKWLEASRSFFSFFYWVFSDYGRSVLFPMGWWALTVLIATVYYLGQHEEVAANRARLQREGHSVIGAYLSANSAAWEESGQACFSAPKEGKNGRAALSEGVAGETRAPWEALQLAFRNGSLVLDGGSEAAQRTYGCLYGFEKVGESGRTVYVPLGVSVASAIQKLFSAVFIFLFGLALRNMLKVK
jgi:hypothetical protein